MTGSKRTTSDKIRILFLAANPMETGRLDLEVEKPSRMGNGEEG